MVEAEKKVTPRVLVITGFIMLATIMQTLDMTIANVALPYMQSGMSAAQDQITWVLTSYVVASAIGMSLTGYFVARFGRTRLFVWSIAGFTIASAACGLAQTLPEIVMFRVLQGFAGACLVPLSQATLMDLYPRDKFGPALAAWGMGVMLGPIFGPTLGGYLTEYLSWRWVFFINLPIGIVCAIGMAALLPETTRQPNTKFDMKGFVFLAVALTSFQLFLDRGHTLDWFASLEIMIEASVAGIAFYLFIVHIFTTDKPFLNPAMFKDQNYVSGILMGFSIGITLMSTMALLPSMLQTLLGYPIIETGEMMMPRGIGTMIAMSVAGKVSRTADPRVLMLSGAVLMGAALWEMSTFDLNVTPFLLSATGAVQGFGIGLFFTALSQASFSTLAPNVRTEGTAVSTLIRNVGSSIGISIVSTVLAQSSQINHAELSEHINPFNRALQGAVATTPLDMTSPEGLSTLNGMISKQAAMIAYIDVFLLMAIVSAVSLPLVFIIRRAPKQNSAAAAAVVREPVHVD